MGLGIDDVRENGWRLSRLTALGALLLLPLSAVAAVFAGSRDVGREGSRAEKAPKIQQISKFRLDFKGGNGAVPTGRWWSVSGGEEVIEIVPYTSGADQHEQKRPGQVYFSDITIKGPFVKDRKAVMDWMNLSARGSHERVTLSCSLFSGGGVMLDKQEVTGHDKEANARDYDLTTVVFARLTLDRPFDPTDTAWQDWLAGTLAGRKDPVEATLRFEGTEGDSVHSMKLERGQCSPIRWEVDDLVAGEAPPQVTQRVEIIIAPKGTLPPPALLLAGFPDGRSLSLPAFWSSPEQELSVAAPLCTGRPALMDWVNAVARGKRERVDMTLAFQNDAGDDLSSYTLSSDIPISYQPPAVSAGNYDMLEESLTFHVNRVEVARREIPTRTLSIVGNGVTGSAPPVAGQASTQQDPSDQCLFGGKFRVTMDQDLPATSFSGGGVTFDKREVTGGERKGTVRTYTITKVNWANIVIEKNVVPGDTKWKEWFEAASRGGVTLKGVTLEYKDSEGHPARSIDFKDCWPIRYDVINVDSRSGSASAKEVIELVVGYATYR